MDLGAVVGLVIGGIAVVGAILVSILIPVIVWRAIRQTSSQRLQPPQRINQWNTPEVQVFDLRGSLRANQINTDRRSAGAERIVCEWCHEQNEPDRTDCKKCGAPLDVKDRVGDGGSAGLPPEVAEILAGVANTFRQSQGGGPFISAARLPASGQRVRGVLKSFAQTGTTPRSLGMTISRPEILDDPIYILDVELQFPDKLPVQGRTEQPVPRAQVPNLGFGMQLTCVVDPADPSHHFVVDWGG
jgi:hypothetical protein